jgi:hypothetical protein
MHPTRIFKTPEELFKAFEEYKTHLELEAGKWLKIQYVGKEGERVTDKYKLPYTLEGFILIIKMGFTATSLLSVRI